MQTVQHFCASNADSTALLRLRTTKVLYCMLILRLKCRQYSTFAPSDDKSAVLYANFAPEMQTVQHFCASKPPPEPSETPGYCRGTKIDAFPIFWKLGNFLRPINASSASMKEAKAKGHLPYWIALRLLPCLVQLSEDPGGGRGGTVGGGDDGSEDDYHWQTFVKAFRLEPAWGLCCGSLGPPPTKMMMMMMCSCRSPSWKPMTAMIHEGHEILSNGNHCCCRC